MTDRPILFSAPMVRAILREIEKPGTGKTMTRRLAKFERRDDYTGNLSSSGIEADNLSPGVWALASRGTGGCWNERTKPLRTYAPGDRLWVRETWRASGTDVWTIADARRRIAPDLKIEYAADHHDNVWQWFPSIHMPREFSRLTLTVTGVKVERLQDITETDAIAEGVEQVGTTGYVIRGFDYDVAGLAHNNPITPFAKLWDSLNGKREGASWADNPWVVAVSFAPELRNIDAAPAERATAEVTA